MDRAIVVAILVVITPAVQAAIVESEWSSSVPVDNDAELVVVDGKMHAVAPKITSYGRELRRWTRFQPTLGADWTVEADVHVDSLPTTIDPLQFVKVGIDVGRPDTDIGLAVLNLNTIPSLPEPHVRGIQSGYSLGPLVGRSDEAPLSATDVMLRLSYTASDQSVRTYFKPLGGEWSPINTYSTVSWKVPADEPLELRLYSEPWFVQLVQGQAYIQDFRLIPEPAASTWLSMLALLPWRRRPRVIQIGR